MDSHRQQKDEDGNDAQDGGHEHMGGDTGGDNSPGDIVTGKEETADVFA